MAGRRKGTVVRTAYDVLARILDDAVKDRRLARNAARGVKLPARVETEEYLLDG